MRIAMIGQKGVPAHFGGVERHVEELALKLVGQGHEVVAYARSWYTPPMVHSYHGITVVHTPTIHTKHLDAIVHTFTATLDALRRKPDIIHYHGVGPALLAWIPRLFARRTKVVVTFHSIDRHHQKWGMLARLFLHLGEWAACRFPHETIVVSKVLEEYCRARYGRETTYIPNGVTASCSTPQLLSQWNLRPFHYVLMVSRLVPHKGAHDLIAAWQLARKERLELLRNFQLVIAGGGHHTEKYVTRLHLMAEHDPSIVFTGWVKGRVLEELYANTALFVHPSEAEGLPIAVLEAMACARPALVSDIPEHREIILDQRFWFSVRDVKALAQKIIHLLEQPRLLEEVGVHNKSYAEKFYNWDTIAAKAEDVYLKN